MHIQVLPPQLISQIAAGEMVERPASVVKELIENSIDAGATHINIDIENGGTKLIRIRDNGSGIDKTELKLALSRHATSKISCFNDLECINSFGFRGEALASISSVSRLTLTSRTINYKEAWQAYTEGGDITISFKPAAHPIGTTVEVLDIFYNIPARRKFMRTAQTEFYHIEEVIRRIALSYFNMTFILQHNGKIVRQYYKISKNNQPLQRLKHLCGLAFVKNANKISWQHEDLAIEGWIADNNPIEIQYSYVNNRMIRDKLITHAIRQAYHEKFIGFKEIPKPSFVLFLNLNPGHIDVNVHPNKNEIRFYKERLVHDFIYQAVSNVIQTNIKNKITAGRNQFSSQVSHVTNIYKDQETINEASSSMMTNTGIAITIKIPVSYIDDFSKKIAANDCYNMISDKLDERTRLDYLEHIKKYNNPTTVEITALNRVVRLLSIYPPCYALIEYSDCLLLISLAVAERYIIQNQLIPDSANKRILCTHSLRIPLCITLKNDEYEALKRHQNLLDSMGIVIHLDHNQSNYKIFVKKVPIALRKQNVMKLISQMFSYLKRKCSITHQDIAAWLINHINSTSLTNHWDQNQAIQVISKLDHKLLQQDSNQRPNKLLVSLNINNALKSIKDLSND